MVNHRIERIAAIGGDKSLRLLRTGDDCQIAHEKPDNYVIPDDGRDFVKYGVVLG